MDKIVARLIFEILGRPAEHVKETLNTLVVKIGSERGVKILEKKYHDPVKVEKTEDLFTTFAEVEMEFDDINKIFGILFLYFPSNVEILSPRKLKINNEGLNEFGNTIIGRLHHYDAISKRLVNEREIIFNKLKQEGIDLNKLFPQPSTDNKPVKKKKKSVKKK